MSCVVIWNALPSVGKSSFVWLLLSHVIHVVLYSLGKKSLKVLWTGDCNMETQHGISGCCFDYLGLWLIAHINR